MQRPWGLLITASLALAACDLPGARQVGGAALDPSERAELATVFKDILSAQQARQQVNVTATSLIADNSAGILSNNSASLTRNAPLVANNTGGLIPGAANYRLAATRPDAPAQQHALPDGNTFYRFGRPGDALIETFVTRVPSVAPEGFEVPDDAILTHARMAVTYEAYDPLTDLDKPITNRYAIEVLKSPVFTHYRSEIRITAPPLGQTQAYVEDASYTLGSLPVTAAATHSAFQTFQVDGQAMALPTSGEERIQLGATRLDLSYRNESGQGIGTGIWQGNGPEAWPLTYAYDFARDQAEMRVSLPKDRSLVLQIRPGMQVLGGAALDRQGETVATLVKRPDGTIVVRFTQGDETVLFE